MANLLNQSLGDFLESLVNTCVRVFNKEFLRVFSKGQRRSTYNNWGHCSLSPQFLEKVSKIVPKLEIFRSFGPHLLKIRTFSSSFATALNAQAGSFAATFCK